jgi:hypothetical protein
MNIKRAVVTAGGAVMLAAATFAFAAACGLPCCL